MSKANEAMNRWIKGRNRRGGGRLLGRLRGEPAPQPAAPTPPGGDLGFKEFNAWAAEVDRRHRERQNHGK
jgi:hypothetical protein